MKSDLTSIPGVGKTIAQFLIDLGYPTVSSLRGVNPEELYQKDCQRQGMSLDPCLLYVYRCAVYVAETPQPNPEKCKWWYWKGNTYPESGGNT